MSHYRDKDPFPAVAPEQILKISPDLNGPSGHPLATPHDVRVTTSELRLMCCSFLERKRKNKRLGATMLTAPHDRVCVCVCVKTPVDMGTESTCRHAAFYQ